MKLRKQAPAKALIVALSAALLGVFYALVRSDPGIAVTAEEGPGVDYDRFFAPSTQPSTNSEPPAPVPRGRTRAS
jgi:hypothetical protein